MPRLDKIYIHEQICEGCWLINEIGINNIYLIEGENSSLLVDAGYGMDNLKDYVEKLTDKPVTVVLTHYHTDHSFGARFFDYCYAHKKDINLYNRLMNSPRIYKRWCDHIGIDPLNVKSVKVKKMSDHAVFDLGGTQVEILPYPGHSKGSVLIVDHRHKLMFGGDNTNLQLWMDIPGGNSLEDWLDTTDKILDYMDKGYKLYGAHGPGLRTREELEINRSLVREIMEMKRSGQIKNRRGIYPSKVDRQHVRYSSRKIFRKKF